MTWTLGVSTLGGSGAGAGTTLDVVVEIALTSGYTTPAASRVWTDITDYVEAQRGLSIQWGRGDQFSSPQPSRLTLTLDNKDGRFTPENAAGAYFPNIKKGRPIRVRVCPSGGSYVHRFLGYVDEWPVEWPDGTSAMSTVTLTAMSRQARLGRSTTLKSIVEEEYLYDVPVLYFPLGEPQGATTAGNIAPGRSEILAITQVGTGGTLTFGQGTGPGTDDLTTPTFTPASITDGVWLRSSLVSPMQPTAASGNLSIEMECFFVADAGQTDSRLLLLLTGNDYSGGFGVIRLVYDATNSAVYASAYPDVYLGAGSASIATANGAAPAGVLHHAIVRATLDDATDKMTVALSLDAATPVTNTAAVTWPHVASGHPFFPTYTQLHVGGLAYPTSTYGLFSGTIAHVAVSAQAGTPTADARFQEHYRAGANGFTTDASGARVARYARLAGIPTAEISTETGLSTSIAHKDTTGQTPISLMQDVAETEDGVVFDGKDGTLTFHARSNRYGATSAFTLDANLGDIEDGFAPKLDDQHLTNDMTASRPNGVKVRSTNDASIAEYGYYRETTEILTTSDNEVQARADWEVNRFGTPRVAIPNVRTSLLTSSVASALLAADIGTKFTLTNLPSQAPATTMDVFIEGGTEQIGANSYFIEFNVSPAAYANVWVLDDPVFSVLDSTTVLAY
jgi:hypothetical protein